MGLYYEEREALAKALRRYVKEATVAEYDMSYKKYLFSLIDKFAERGYGALVGTNDQNAFDGLLRLATY